MSTPNPDSKVLYRGHCPNDGQQLELILSDGILSCPKCGYKIKRITFDGLWHDFDMEKLAIEANNDGSDKHDKFSQLANQLLKDLKERAEK